VGYAINFGEVGKTLNKRFLKTALVRELERNPTDARLYSMLGSIYYQDKAYPQAIEAYERSLELESGNAETLNNLAWLYATCEDENWREPVKALVYAVHAAALKPVPHILDTLAESYFVNGLHEKAVVTIKNALKMQPDDRAYFQRQLKKFEKARLGETP
jgi:cytochrome c-type biogenesis protein CcmH/NrfG